MLQNAQVSCAKLFITSLKTSETPVSKYVHLFILKETAWSIFVFVCLCVIAPHIIY